MRSEEKGGDPGEGPLVYATVREGGPKGFVGECEELRLRCDAYSDEEAVEGIYAAMQEIMLADSAFAGRWIRIEAELTLPLGPPRRKRPEK